MRIRHDYSPTTYLDQVEELDVRRANHLSWDLEKSNLVGDSSQDVYILIEILEHLEHFSGRNR